MKEAKKKPIPTEEAFFNEDKAIEADSWIRKTFAEDVTRPERSGFNEDGLMLCPMMRADSWQLIHDYYAGKRYIVANISISGSGRMVHLSKFVKPFHTIIDTALSIKDNLKNLIEYSIEKDNGYVWYFNLYLDKNTYENFIDVRSIFADLYAKYARALGADGKPNDYEKATNAILEANAEFQKFIRIDLERQSTEGENYKKAFFSL